MPHSDRVLVVDDNAATRYSVRRVLERHGYSVSEAATGQEGLDRLADAEFGAMVLDVNLPDMSGFDVVRQLRTRPRTRLLPVVHVSAASIATGDMITGLDNGADGYLIHPVDPDVLLATLRSLLRARRAEEALRDADARFQEIFSQINAPIAVLDEQLQIRESNPAFARLLSEADANGSLFALLGSNKEFVLDLQDALARQERWQGVLSIAGHGRACATRNGG